MTGASSSLRISKMSRLPAAGGRKPLRFAERNRRRPERGKLLGAAFENRGALHEVEHAEARGKPRRARGRQHVVRARHIIADRLRRMGAEKDRAGVADLPREAL